MKLGYVAVDQYGHTEHLTEPKAPRKQLLDKLGTKHAVKMYVDTKDGGNRHAGYVINRQWFSIYEVHSWGTKD